MSFCDPLSAQLKTVLSGVLDASSNPTFVDIKEYPTTSFSGYPSAIILPSNGQTGSFETQIENVRFYVFDVIIYYQAETGQDTDWRNMRQLMDATMDAIDKTIDLNGKCDFVRPAVGGWGVDQTSTGATLVGTITVICQTTVHLQ